MSTLGLKIERYKYYPLISKVCGNCNKQFQTRNPVKRFCGHNCSAKFWGKNDGKESRTRSHWKWVEKNRDKLREYYKRADSKRRIPLNQNTMLGNSAVQKGKVLENFVADRLVATGIDTRARRSIGSGSGNREKGDISNGLNLNIECKNTKQFAFAKSWRQAMRDAQITHNEPVLIWHPPNVPLENSAVIVNIEYFIELLKVKKNYTPKEDILDRWSVKHNLDVAVNALRKVIKDV